MEKVQGAELFIGGLPGFMPSAACTEAVVPFMCLFIFQLCDSDGQVYQPTMEECEEVTEGVCENVFEDLRMAAALIGREDQLPQCELLPETSLNCNGEFVIT